jgi:serine phosphatase RsbU (regulator of sigma subunit)
MRIIKDFFKGIKDYIKQPENYKFQIVLIVVGIFIGLFENKSKFLQLVVFDVSLFGKPFLTIGYILKIVLPLFIGQQILLKELKKKYKREQDKNSEVEKSLADEREEKEELIQSLEAARRIQNGILPDVNQLQRTFLDVQLYYLPKDIIGGDFYWYKEIGDYNFLAIADCTGHGTSGALLSVMCSNFLTKAVGEDGLINTNEILNECRDALVGNWSKTHDTIRDGMDISLLRIHKSSGELQWSGANSNLWLIKGDAVSQFKGNRQAIARSEQYEDFNSHDIPNVSGSLLFMSTDGLFDQFGGTEDRKLGKKRVIQALTAQSELREKKEALVEMFSSWKFKTEQTDDVCFLLMSVA